MGVRRPAVRNTSFAMYRCPSQVAKRMIHTTPPFAEKRFHRRIGHLIQTCRFPAGRVVLVDQQGSYALDEVALLETLLDDAEFHAKTIRELHRFAPLQLTPRDAQHRRGTAAHELRGLLRPIRVLRPGFALERLQYLRHGGVREMAVDGGT